MFNSIAVRLGGAAIQPHFVSFVMLHSVRVLLAASPPFLPNQFLCQTVGKNILRCIWSDRRAKKPNLATSRGKGLYFAIGVFLRTRSAAAHSWYGSYKLPFRCSAACGSGGMGLIGLPSISTKKMPLIKGHYLDYGRKTETI